MEIAINGFPIIQAIGPLFIVVKHINENEDGQYAKELSLPAAMMWVAVCAFMVIIILNGG